MNKDDKAVMEKNITDLLDSEERKIRLLMSTSYEAGYRRGMNDSVTVAEGIEKHQTQTRPKRGWNNVSTR